MAAIGATRSIHYASNAQLASPPLRVLAEDKPASLERKDTTVENNNDQPNVATWICSADGLRAARDGAGTRVVQKIRSARRT